MIRRWWRRRRNGRCDRCGQPGRRHRSDVDCTQVARDSERMIMCSPELASHIVFDARFWAQVARDSERTIMCSPELESRIKTLLAVRGWSHLVTVKTNRFLPEDTILLLDEHAIDAERHRPAPWFGDATS